MAWKPHLFRIGESVHEFDEAPKPEQTTSYRQEIEPWLSALFQSEHLSLLIGSGFTRGIAAIAQAPSATMRLVELKDFSLADVVLPSITASAKATDRGEPNVEDQIRALSQLIAAFDLLGDKRKEECQKALESVLTVFLESVCATEEGIRATIYHDDSKTAERSDFLKRVLVSFLLSFAARAAGRERLHLFTTNYDRLVECGCDLAGLRIIDRFVGGLTPVFRSSRLEVDLHYNPPGIRGEPRYLEGVVRFTKLHGSIDWRTSGESVVRHAVPLGSMTSGSVAPSDVRSVMVYPNPAKELDTAMYPYAELFRDFSGALSRPNSVLVTYGYGFGDDHINRVIADMLTIPSTHLVIVSYDSANGRIQRFVERTGRDTQTTLLIGSHFGDLATLVSTYLPKGSVELVSLRRAAIVRDRSTILGAQPITTESKGS